MIASFHRHHTCCIWLNCAMALSANGYKIRKLIGTTNAPRNNMVDVKAFAPSPKIRLVNSTSLARIVIAAPSCFRRFFPIISAAVMSGRSAFPRWMLSAADVLHLPRRITLFCTKECLVTDERSKRFSTVFATFGYISYAAQPTFNRTIVEMLKRMCFIFYSASVARSDNAFAARRSYLSPSGVSACFRAEPFMVAM
jgi:hypothetical protein